MNHSFPIRWKTLAALSALLLGGSAAFAATPQTLIANAGLYGLIPTDMKATNATVTSFLTSADFSGISARTYWNEIETMSGGVRSYDWTYLDSMISAAVSHGKKALLRVEAAWNTPSFVVSAGALMYGPYNEPHNGGAASYMPVPWDATFQSEWALFIAAMGTKYSGNANVAGIVVEGCSRSSEMYLPTTAMSGPSWTASPYNYTPATLETAWNSVIDEWAAAFPSTPLFLSVSQVLGDSTNDPTVITGVLEHGTSNYPWQFCAKISYWQAGQAITFYPTVSYLATIDAFTHGGLEAAGIMTSADASGGATTEAEQWHALTMVEPYIANVGDFHTLSGVISTHKAIVAAMAFTAKNVTGGVQLNWTNSNPSIYGGIEILRGPPGDYPAGVNDTASTAIYTGSATSSGSYTDSGLINGHVYHYAIYETGTGSGYTGSLTGSAYTVGQAFGTPKVP